MLERLIRQRRLGPDGCCLAESSPRQSLLIEQDSYPLDCSEQSGLEQAISPQPSETDVSLGSRDLEERASVERTTSPLSADTSTPSAGPAKETPVASPVPVTLGNFPDRWLCDYDMQTDNALAEGLVFTRIDVAAMRNALLARSCSSFLLLRYLIGRKACHVIKCF
jgi:hypothetical protein